MSPANRAVAVPAPDRPRREVSRKREDPKDDFDDDGLEEIVLDDDLDGDLDDDQGSDELDLGVDGEDSDDASGRGAPAGHKSIPSWDEAIGMIVDTNLATRTDRRRSSPPQSRGALSRAVGDARNRSRGVANSNASSCGGTFARCATHNLRKIFPRQVCV